MLKYLLLGAAAAHFALLMTPMVRRLAWQLGAVDHPGGRHAHREPTPRLGGLAVLIGFLAAVSLGWVTDVTGYDVFHGHGWGWWSLFAGAVVVTAGGAADDVWSIGPIPKLLFQTFAGFLVWSSGYGIEVVTNPIAGGSFELGWLAMPVTLLWVVGITNAFNLIDGLDGLAAGIALIASATLFVLGLSAGRVDVALIAITLAGALAGFLRHNFHPASIFLGDSGSLLLGFMLSVLSIQASQKGATAVVILAPMLALGLPIADTLLAMVRRVLGALRVVRVDAERNQYQFLVVGSTSIFQADRDHIHHRLVKLGMTHRRAVMTLYAAGVILSALTLIAVASHGDDVLVLVTVIAFTGYAIVRHLGYEEVSLLGRGTLLPLFDLPALNRRVVHVLVDSVLLLAAFVAAFHVTNGEVVDRRSFLSALVTIVAVKICAFLWDGVYRRAYRYTDAADALSLLRCLTGAEIVAAGFTLLLYGSPPNVLVVFLLDFYFTLTLVLGARLSFRILEVLQRSPAEAKRAVLIYSAGLSGTTLLREIQRNPAMQREVVGFLDDHTALRDHWVNGALVYGGWQDVEAAVRATGADEVVIASGKIPAERVHAVAETCARLGISVCRFQMSLERVAIDDLAEADAPQRRRAVGR